MTALAREKLRQDLIALGDGDRAAFEPVFEALWPRLLTFCTRALGSRSDGEDAAQGAVVKLFAQASVYDRRRDPIGWALVVAAYECRTIRKRRSRRRETMLDAKSAPEIPDSTDPEAALSRRETMFNVGEVIEGLSAQDRETLMAALEEEKRPRVAGATFRKRLERALTRLRSAWRAKHGVS